MKRYRGYLFDLDGTLVDTAPDINVALNHALTSYNHAAVTQAHTRHWIGHGAKSLIGQALAAETGCAPDPEYVEKIRATFLDHYEAHIADHSREYPGTTQALIKLKKAGARLAVVTNKVTRLSIHLLNTLELSRHFDVVVCGDTAANPKPAADPALFACAALALPVPEVLFVGDSSTDVECARAARCDIVCVRDGYNHGVPPDELGADAVIESISDLV